MVVWWWAFVGGVVCALCREWSVSQPASASLPRGRGPSAPSFTARPVTHITQPGGMVPIVSICSSSSAVALVGSGRACVVVRVCCSCQRAPPAWSAESQGRAPPSFLLLLASSSFFLRSAAAPSPLVLVLLLLLLLPWSRSSCLVRCCCCHHHLHCSTCLPAVLPFAASVACLPLSSVAVEGR